METVKSLRTDISKLVKKYAELKYEQKVFEPGKDIVPPSGKVIGITELQYMVDASLDGWLTAGRFNDQLIDLDIKIRVI